MTIVIPYINNGERELKYCLRGIEKYYPEAEVMIVGDQPDFKRIWHVPATDTPGLLYKERNIFHKVLKAAELIPEFLFMNDDHFLLSRIEENYYEGTVKQWLDKYDDNSYKQTLKNTFNCIGDQLYYDIHCPIIMKSSVVNIIAGYDWDLEFGLCFKSIYANSIHKGTEYPDLKFNTRLMRSTIEELIEGRKWFSTGNECWNTAMTEVLESLYPEKSKFEK